MRSARAVLSGYPARWAGGVRIFVKILDPHQVPRVFVVNPKDARKRRIGYTAVLVKSRH